MNKNNLENLRRITKVLKKTTIFIIWLTYLAFLFYLVFLRNRFMRTNFNQGFSLEVYKNYFKYGGLNLTPLKTIRFYLFNVHNLSFKTCMTNIGGNVLAFVPFGFLSPFIFGKLRSFKKIIIVSCFLSISIEVLQMIFLVGSFDIDDIILNTLGGIIGFLFYYIFRLLFIGILTPQNMLN